MCRATISLLGHEKELVVKVAPFQPWLFGLDAMLRFGMSVNLPARTFELFTDTQRFASKGMISITSFADLLRYKGLTEADLVPVGELKAPLSSFVDAMAAEQAHRIIDLGTS